MPYAVAAKRARIQDAIVYGAIAVVLIVLSALFWSWL
jgi:asparagine N-glycosylation enzyme membrane subunit Stt3